MDVRTPPVPRGRKQPTSGSYDGAFMNAAQKYYVPLSVSPLIPGTAVDIDATPPTAAYCPALPCKSLSLHRLLRCLSSRAGRVKFPDKKNV